MVTGAADRERAGPAQGGGIATRPSRRGKAVVGLVLILLAAMAGGNTRAGQVRINVGSPSFQFTPRVANLNLGDHAVWVWIGGSHTVSSGDSSTVTTDGIFDSTNGSDMAGSGLRYSWKSTQTGNIPYFCFPHAPGMAGRVVVQPLTTPASVAVADFRLTEVQFNVAGGQDLIEVANLGPAAGNLGRFRIATAVGTPTELPSAAATPNDIIVPAGGRVVIHLNASGTNSNTDIYMSFAPGTGLPDVNGSLALYVPANQAFQNPSSNKDLIIDFVQWGAGNQANEATAGLANFWAAGTSINGVAPGHSIEYCQNSTLDHGVAHWAEIAPPNFGGNDNCTTPTLRDTWGHLKIIYRR